jgi:hypothetical protein
MTENKRPALLGAAAWGFILAGGYFSVVAARNAFVLFALFSSPGFMLGLAGSTLPVEMPPLARLAAERMPLVFAAYFFFWAGVCIAGMGLLARKAWGLASARWLCYIAAACCLVLLLFPGLVVPKPYTYRGVSLTPEFNAVVGAIRIQLRLITVVLGVCALWLARRLEKPDIRNEFK